MDKTKYGISYKTAEECVLGSDKTKIGIGSNSNPYISCSSNLEYKVHIFETPEDFFANFDEKTSFPKFITTFLDYLITASLIKEEDIEFLFSNLEKQISVAVKNIENEYKLKKNNNVFWGSFFMKSNDIYFVFYLFLRKIKIPNSTKYHYIFSLKEIINEFEVFALENLEA